MSIFDELQQAAAQQNPLDDIRLQIQALRDQAKAAFNAQFLLGSEDNEKSAVMKGRFEAFDECLQLFVSDADDVETQGSRKWADEE